MAMVPVKFNTFSKIPQAEELIQEHALRRILGQPTSNRFRDQFANIQPRVDEFLLPPQGRLGGVVDEYFNEKVIPQAQFLRKPAKFATELVGAMTRPTQLLTGKGMGAIGGVGNVSRKGLQKLFDTGKLQKIQSSGKLYRGISQAEYDDILKTKQIKSTGEFSFTREGTVFSDNINIAESSTNFGRTNPLKTGKSNYVIEVKKLPEIRLDKSDFNYKTLESIDSRNITKVLKFSPSKLKEWKEGFRSQKLIVEDVTEYFKKRLTGSALSRNEMIEELIYRNKRFTSESGVYYLEAILDGLPDEEILKRFNRMLKRENLEVFEGSVVTQEFVRRIKAK